MEKLNRLFIGQKGFTLMEILLYSFFFALIITLFLASGFMVAEVSSDLNKKISVEQEGNFLIGKINWALNSARQAEANLNQLTVYRYGGLPDVIFSFSSNNLEMEIAGQWPKVILNTQGTKLENWYVKKDLVNNAEIIKLGFVIGSESFSATNMLPTW